MKIMISAKTSIPTTGVFDPETGSGTVGDNCAVYRVVGVGVLFGVWVGVAVFD